MVCLLHSLFSADQRDFMPFFFSLRVCSKEGVKAGTSFTLFFAQWLLKLLAFDLERHR